MPSAPSSGSRVAGRSNQERIDALGLPGPLDEAVRTAQDEAGQVVASAEELGLVLDRLGEAIAPRTLVDALDRASLWTNAGLTVVALDRSRDVLGLSRLRQEAIERELLGYSGPTAALLRGWFSLVSAEEARLLMADLPPSLDGHLDLLLVLFPPSVLEELTGDPAEQPGSTDPLVEAKGELFEGDVRPEDVNQAGLDDCWLVAALGSLAQTNPEAIQSMIQQTGGQYRVRLFVPATGDSQRWEPIWVAVDARLPVRDGLRVGAQDSRGPQVDGELWVAVIEKAVAKLYGSYPTLNVAPAPAITLLTGEVSANFERGDDGDTVWTGLVRALADGKPATAGMTVPAGQHAFSILAATEGAQGRTVEVRDQAGHFHQTRQRQTLPWDQFREEVRVVRYPGAPTQETGLSG